MSEVPVLKTDENFERLMVRLKAVTQEARAEHPSFAPNDAAPYWRSEFGKRKVAPKPHS